MLELNKIYNIDCVEGLKQINYENKNPDILIATLDKQLSDKLKNGKIIIRGKKKLEII